ncbi:hypothetical protein PZA11_001259 [Diplocarpon coronariae]|uniref:HMG box domain-containing protein n=1 Tax=Diplocarpon coronariae TaxID=2795749 RepID=A0A218ZA36_9HELO|nr:hypothetical protein B2J93_4247 [Marssonina coronariae]
MLSTVRSAAVRRVAARGPESTDRALQGVRQIKLVAAQNSTTSLARFTFSLKRTYSVVGRIPKPTVGTSTVLKPKVKEKKVAAKKSVKKPIEKSIKRKVAKKPVVKKPVKKPVKKLVKKPVKNPVKKPVKKVLTDKQKATAARRKASLKVKALKATALSLPKQGAFSPWMVYVAENVKERPQGALGLTKELGAKFRSLSQSDSEYYKQVAVQNRVDYKAAYETFVASQDPEVIRRANIARRALRTLAPKGSWPPIRDPRAPKRPTSSWMIYSTDRHASGDVKDIPFFKVAAHLRKEFLALDPSERQVYDDRAAASKAQYIEKFKEVYKRDPPFLSKTVATAGSSL